jgi:parallel beta-helix repeat protein
MKSASAYVRMLVASLGLSSVAFASQGVQRLLYTSPNSTFVSQPTGEVLVTVNDTSGSIATLQTEINNARTANPSNVIVINLASVTYTVSTSSLTLGSNMCLVASGATIKAANSSVAVPLITISSGASLVSIGGGVLDGGGANIQGIYAPAAARVNIDKVTVQNCGQDCISLSGQGTTTYDNEMTVTRCDVSGSLSHAGIAIQNSTQTYVGDNFCHNNSVGISVSGAWGIVANNVCNNDGVGISVAGGSDNVVGNNTCNNNGTGISAAGSNGMIVSNALGGNSTAGIASTGSGNSFLDNLFATGNGVNFSSGGTSDNIVAYKTALSASAQNYFYPPLIDNQHTDTTIITGKGRTDLTIDSTTIDDVQSQYNTARTANPNNVIVLHLIGTYTVGASPLTLSSNTCVLLSGTILINSSTTASRAISIGASQYVSISGGVIDAGGLSGHQGINATGGAMIQIDSVTIQNFGSNVTSLPGSDALQLANCATPNEVTRCVINNSGSRGLWQQNYSAKGKVLYTANTVHGTRAGLDCDSSTYGIVALFNEFSSNTYGLWCEQSAQHNLGIGNVANKCTRTEYNIGNLDHSPGTNYNTYICNTTAGGSRALQTSATQTGTTATESSHNFLFNNVIVAGSITSNQIGTENHYSQNYLAPGGNFTTTGAETIFNSVGVSSVSYLVGVGSGLQVLVQGASTTSGAPVVIDAASGLGNDLWTLVPTGDGYYTVANMNSGLVVAIAGASTSAGAPAVQANFGSAQNDQWMVMSAGDGFYYLINRKSGLCLDVPAGGAGTQLDQQPYIGGANQKFALGLSSVIVTQPPSPPVAPTGLTATANGTQASLNWTASPGATSYNVKRATTSGGPYTTVATGVTTTTYTDGTVLNGTTYYYVVSAVNSAGESPNSAEANTAPGSAVPYKIALPLTAATASSSASGFPASNSIDGSLSTRWAGSGDGVWIRYDLGKLKMIDFVKIAVYLGTSRTYTFDVQVSTDATNWTQLLTRVKNPATTALVTYDFPDTYARYVRIVGHKNTSDAYTNITEFEAWVDDRVPAAAPTFSPAGGTFNVAQFVALSTTTPGAAIRYTLDGSQPTRSTGTVYSDPIFVDLGTTTVKAITYSNDLLVADSAVTSATYTIVDNTPPVLTLPSNLTAEATSPSGAVVTFTVSAEDDFDGTVPATATPASGSTFPLGITTVNVTAHDASGNTATGTFTVTVRDTTPPIITSPANITAEATGPAGAVVTFTASATDLVDGTVPVSASPASGSTFPLGTTTVKLTSTDAHGNTATSSFTVTVHDTTPPTIATPANIIAEATGPTGAVVTFTASATDLVDGAVPVSALPASGSTFPLGTTMVKLTSTDAHGNTATSSFTVTVRDTTPPAIATPANLTAEATGPAGAVVTFTASATDLVDGAVPVSASPASGSTFPLGTTTVKLTSTDAHGNTATSSFTVTVQDTTPPTFKSLTASPDTLWPVNHKLVAITVTAKLADLVDPAPTAHIVSVTCNEPSNGVGDGNTPADWEVTGPLTLDLRAERAGNLNDRVYTITVEARDQFGNTSQKSVDVTVPHNHP